MARALQAQPLPRIPRKGVASVRGISLFWDNVAGKAVCKKISKSKFEAACWIPIGPFFCSQGTSGSCKTCMPATASLLTAP